MPAINDNIFCFEKHGAQKSCLTRESWIASVRLSHIINTSIFNELPSCVFLSKSDQAAL